MTGCDQSDQLGLLNVMIDVSMLGLVEQPGRRTGEIMTGGILDVVVLAWLVAVIGTPASQAQTRVPKREAACPMGYVDTAQGTCSTLGLMTYTLKPSNGDACPAGWVNVGGGYCREQ